MYNPIALKDCPVGLFLSLNGELCLKTEYDNNAYIVSTGEKFWGGAKTHAQLYHVKVFPVQFKFKDTRHGLIEAEALKNTIRGWIADIESDIEWESDIDKAAIDALECVLAQIDSMTAIDAEPVMRGRWIRGENWAVTCSVCGCLAIAHDGKNYCPNCGAKMDLVEENAHDE